MKCWDDMNLHERINLKGLVATDGNQIFKQIYALASLGGWRYAIGTLYLMIKNS